jgi:hypothetical protein
VHPAQHRRVLCDDPAAPWLAVQLKATSRDRKPARVLHRIKGAMAPSFARLTGQSRLANQTKDQ